MFVETKRQGEVQIPLEPWRQTLLDAARYIETHGWVQGELGTCDGPVCAMGALHYLPGVMPENQVEAWGRLMTYLKLSNEIVNQLHPIAAWNDAPERTKDEVVAALRAAAFA